MDIKGGLFWVSWPWKQVGLWLMCLLLGLFSSFVMSKVDLLILLLFIYNFVKLFGRCLLEAYFFSRVRQNGNIFRGEQMCRGTGISRRKGNYNHNTYCMNKEKIKICKKNYFVVDYIRSLPLIQVLELFLSKDSRIQSSWNL